MKLKNTEKTLWLPVSDKHYKRPYLMRKIEEQEAEEAIKDYDGEDARDLPIPTDIERSRKG